MDDDLESPSALPTAPASEIIVEDAAELSEEEEDGGLDWTKLLPPAARPVIPKRGEKEYEPRVQGGTDLQVHVLERSRSAMYQTLQAPRTISSKAISYAVWAPGLSRAHVTLARGIHFSSMGHSAPRLVTDQDGVEKLQKRLELLPEEAIYLIERGSLLCWKEADLGLGSTLDPSSVSGSPMSVQQAFAEMIGKEDLTLEKFQVYAYLRRLGYIVTRAQPPDENYPLPPPFSLVSAARSPISQLLAIIRSLLSSWNGLFNRFDPWKPVHFSRWFNSDKNYRWLYSALRFIPAGHSVSLKTSPRPPASPYTVFYNLYKPATAFKKSSPPLPDFQIVVVNARSTPMPTLQELTHLFGDLPETPIPPPRVRRSPIGNPAPLIKPQPNPPKPSEPTFLQKYFPWLFGTTEKATHRPNLPFISLKHGKKVIIIAAVDSGNTSFFRFAQGEFSEWPMM